MFLFIYYYDNIYVNRFAFRFTVNRRPVGGYGYTVIQEVFKRYELKYIINEETKFKLLNALEGRITADVHGDENGFYNINNLYFDSDSRIFLSETVNKKRFRQKLRLRAYNDVDLDSNVFLEIKKKHKGVVSKRRTLLKLDSAYDFLKLNDKIDDYGMYKPSNVQILREVEFLKNYFELKPKVIVSYDRQAFQGVIEDDLRITFDSNLRRRWVDLVVEKGPWGDLFLDRNQYILEVKVNNRVPLWLARILNELQCYQQSFSKYTSCYEDAIPLEKLLEAALN